MPVLLDDKHTAHRPWPLPASPWLLKMSWHDLLFLHWPVDVAALRPHIPERLEIDTFDGVAWLGVVPFRMSGVGPRFVPSVPGVSTFPEINLRTYVRANGKPGVWFFSLDVTKRLAVLIARGAFHLPYFKAEMNVREEDGWIHYSSQRREARERSASKASTAAAERLNARKLAQSMRGSRNAIASTPPTRAAKSSAAKSTTIRGRWNERSARLRRALCLRRSESRSVTQSRCCTSHANSTLSRGRSRASTDAR